MIIRAIKSGITTLINYLAQHPHICPSITKETEYFSLVMGHDKYKRGEYFDFLQYEKQLKIFKEIFKDKTHLVLEYEDDIQSDPKKAYYKICEFLNVLKTDISVNYKKTNPYLFEQIIENFNEVSSVLKRTAYEWMLNE